MTWALSALFFLSGLTGLIYEVLWAKTLALTLGSTALAQAVVLATFLGGLALGNARLGPEADSAADPLRLYATLEFAVGLLALLSPVAFELLSKAYLGAAGGAFPAAAFLLKTGLSAAVILLPAFCMGGTLPALSRLASARLDQLEGAVSRFYFLNSLGAALGALMAGFLLIPWLGLETPVLLAAGMNLLIGAAALALSGRGGSVSWEPRPRPVPKLSPVQRRTLLAALFVSGFASLSYEVAWTRLLSLVLGSSAYSFSIMLSAFICGIALGSLLVARGAFPSIGPYALFGAAELGLAFCVLLTLPVYERLPYGFMVLSTLIKRTPDAFYILEAVKFAFCFALMLAPTACLGMTLPLASRALTKSVSKAGAGVGLAFSVNTFGNVLGALAAGLLLLPRLKLEGLFQLAACLNAAAALAVFYSSRRKRAAALALAVLAAIGLMPRWNLVLMCHGVYRVGDLDKTDYASFKQALSKKSLLFHQDDPNATVTVVKNEQGILFLKVNGKSDASTSFDMGTQILSAQVPLLLKPGAEDVLLIGLGSGVSAGSVLSHPVRSLDLVEISPAVAKAARQFDAYNHRALDDPRLALHLDDGKAFLKLDRRRYDIISSEPSNPWVAGVGNLFTAGFYREARAHLRPGGLMVQWCHLYEMTDDTLRLVLRTFASVFPRVTLWQGSINDILLVGSEEPLPADFARMEEELKRPAVQADLGRVRLSSLSAFLSLQIADDAAVRELAGEGRKNEDLFPLLEYEAPKAFFLDKTTQLIQNHDERLVPARDANELLFNRYLSRRKKPLSRGEFLDIALFHGQYGGYFYEAVLRAWLAKYPQDPDARLSFARYLKAQGKSEAALWEVRSLLSARPSPEAYELASELETELFLRGSSALDPGEAKRVLGVLSRALKAGRQDTVSAYKRMAQVYEKSRDYKNAAEFFARAAQAARGLNPPSESLWLDAAAAALKGDEFDAALFAVRKILDYDPSDAMALNLARHLEALQRERQAPGR